MSFFRSGLKPAQLSVLAAMVITYYGVELHNILSHLLWIPDVVRLQTVARGLDCSIRYHHEVHRHLVANLAEMGLHRRVFFRIVQNDVFNDGDLAYS